MKRLFVILFCIGAMASTSFAMTPDAGKADAEKQEQVESPKQTTAVDPALVDAIKLALAKEVSKGSLDSDNKADEKGDIINQTNSMKALMDSLEGTLDMSRNVPLCSFIRNVKIETADAKTVNGKDIEDFVNDVFAQKEFEGYVKNRSNNKTLGKITDNCVKAIGKSIQKYEKEKEAQAKAAAKSQSQKRERKPSAFPFALILKLLAVLLLLALIGAGVYFFMLFRKASEDNHSLRQHLEDKNQHIQELKMTEANLRKKYEQLLAEKARLEEELSRKEAPVAQAAAAGAAAAQVITYTEKTYYLGMPNETGAFTQQYDSYRSGKTLYKVLTLDGCSGSFEFICQPDAVGIAKNSRTVFLEPACTIENDADVFDAITIVKPGKVEYVDDAWKIVEKVVIRLN